MAQPVQVRRVYDEPADTDGTRIFVDRLWPRGLRKDAFSYDEWRKDVAPSAELRTWYGHEPAKFGEFRERYRHELEANPVVGRLRALAGLTLLTATKDIQHSHATVLAELLDE